MEAKMKISGLAVLLGLICLAASPAASADRAAELMAEDASVAAVPGASITILAPADGAHLKAGEENTLSYEVTPGEGGDHFHVWVDDKRGPGVHDNKGTYTLPKMAPGEHLIYIAIVTKDHMVTGPKRSIRVTVDAK
jgi:ABC-type transport system substrate-binding protein